MTSFQEQKRQLIYRYGTQEMINNQCTKDLVQVALWKRDSDDTNAAGSVTMNAINACWNKAARRAFPNIREVEQRLSEATGKKAVVDRNIDASGTYVAVHFENKD